MTAVYYRRGGDTSGSAANGHPEPRNWAIRVSIGRKSVVTTFKPRGATVVVMRGTAEAVGPERRDPVHLALNLPESVSKAVRRSGRRRCRGRARGFHGSKDKVLLVFRLLLKKPTKRPTDRRSQRASEARDHYYLFFSSLSSFGRLLSRRRRRRNGPPPPPPPPPPFPVLSSRLSRQCKVIALTRAATVIRARVRAWLAKELRTKSLDWKATS